LASGFLRTNSVGIVRKVDGLSADCSTRELVSVFPSECVGLAVVVAEGIACGVVNLNIPLPTRHIWRVGLSDFKINNTVIDKIGIPIIT